jgi:hypothetical protein
MNNCWSEEQHKQISEYASEHLWRYIQQNASLINREKTFLDITGLSNRNLEKLTQIHFLLSEDVHVFVNETAPSILSRLSKSSTKETVTLRGKIKGKVMWSKTVTSRYASGGDPSLFVCQQRSSVFDLPENRVFLYVLKQIQHFAVNILGSKVTDNIEWEIKNKEKWSSIIHSIGVQSAKLLRNPFVREISDIYNLSEKVIQETEKARGTSYSELAETARSLYKSTQQPMDFLYQKLSTHLLLPLNQDVLYEIAVLYKIIEHTKEKGWSEKTINLIGGGSKIISRFRKKNVVMNIHYQSLPQNFYGNSKYKDMMNHYSIDAGFRRPDIILEWIRADGERRYCIVEVKRSENRTYLIDGLYKLLGYIKDFEEVFSGTPDSKGILVGWDTHSSSNILEEDEVYFSGWNNLNEHFDVIEKNVFEKGWVTYK